jgi:trans-2,3-dihydro-3-hydroxyanthranilate isomerase
MSAPRSCRTSYGRPVNGDSVIFEEKAGLVPIEVLRDGVKVVGARLASPQRLTVGAQIAVELVASACGISPGDIEMTHHRPCIASCGAPFILAELKSRNALAAASPNSDVFRLEVTKHPAVSIMLYTQVDEGDIDIRARMFAPHLNIPEDPATGSANVALIGLLAKLRSEPNLALSKNIAQGVEMRRPSLLVAHAEKQDGAVTATFISGRCVPVMSGTIDVA